MLVTWSKKGAAAVYWDTLRYTSALLDARYYRHLLLPVFNHVRLVVPL